MKTMKDWRNRHSLTQAIAARVLGYGHQSRVAEIETGARKPSLSVRLLMAAYSLFSDSQREEYRRLADDLRKREEP